MDIPTVRLLEDKLLFLKECIEIAEDQLRVRQGQKQAFISEIEQKACEVQNAIIFLDQPCNFRNSVLSRRRMNLDSELKKLEKERRQQELECWRDIVELEKELRKLKKGYRAVK